MKISIVLGTRPEIIKMSPIIRECEQLNLDYYILHTGQHYSYNMDSIFFEQLRLPRPDYNLEIGSGTHAQQTGHMLIKIENVLKKNPVDVVLVQGDTNTVLAAAITASKLRIDIGHVEAGLRSYDRSMPEEINRILADHSSSLLFAPTQKSKNILLNEGIPEQKIFLTGNTIVDAINVHISFVQEAIANDVTFSFEEEDYLLVTLHRQENVDDKTRFQNILIGLQQVHKEFGYPIIYPIHPRAKKQLHKYEIDAKNITMIDPVDYLGFLRLEKQAKLILTDSGGVQEESCILRVPCVTLRDNTERPETIDVGANVIAGTNPEKITTSVKLMLKSKRKWKNPFGDGQSGKRIVKIMREKYE